MKILLITAFSLVPAACFAESFTNVTVTNSLNVSGTLATLGGANSAIRGLNCGDAPGAHSISLGPGTSANGQYSGSFGYSTSVPGNHSFAFGYANTIPSNSGMALGADLVVNSYRMVAVGSNNAYQLSGAYPSTWEPTDLLFVVGNGPYGGTRSNALEIYKNGNLIGKGADNRLPLQTTLPDNSSILTRALGDSRYFSSLTGQISLGQYSTADGNAALIVGNGTISTPANSLKLMKNGGIEAATLTTSGNATVAGNFTASKAFLDVAGTEYLSRSIASFNPSSANGQRILSIQGRAQTSGAQNLTRSLNLGGGLNGVEGHIVHSGSGTVTAAVAVAGAIQNTSTGAMTNAAAFMGRTPTASSTGLITTAYGLYIQDQKTGVVTGNGYGVFAAGTDNLNVLAGQVRVGSESDPAAGIELDVAGDAAFSGNATVTGQFVTGSWEVADANAAIIVGNGTDTNNRANSFVVKKDGAVEVATVVRVPASGDISMGAFN